jgi:hypothetical protein
MHPLFVEKNEKFKKRIQLCTFGLKGAILTMLHHNYFLEMMVQEKILKL